MKALILSLAMFSTPAFAITDEAIDLACRSRAEELLKTQADSYGCVLNGPTSMRSIDNRWYNPSKYAWYAAPTAAGCQYSEIVKMVQYYDGKCL